MMKWDVMNCLKLEEFKHSLDEDFADVMPGD